MKVDSEQRLKDILNTLLDVLDQNKVTPEDGALLSANLLFNALTFLKEEGSEEVLFQALNQIMDILLGGVESSFCPAVFKANSLYSFGPNNGWGLDPVLLDEEH